MVGPVSQLKHKIQRFLQNRNLKLALNLERLIDGSILGELDKSGHFERISGLTA
jgi:hypothetical protein